MKNYIDMSRPHAAYLTAVGFLMLLSILSSNMPAFALSSYVDIPYQKVISGVFFGLGAITGIIGLQRHQNRAQYPWRVPQAQVSIFFTIFFVTSLLGVILSK